jgi:hypothetical protein
MFYVKAKLSDEVEITVEIHDDNVFCICPGCGGEVEVDLAEILSTGDSDLYGTEVFCSKCSKDGLEGERWTGVIKKVIPTLHLMKP